MKADHSPENCFRYYRFPRNVLVWGVFFGNLVAILSVFLLCFCLVPSNTCVCDEDGLCEEGGAQVCAEVSGSAAHRTMTECEVGLLRCRGETVTLVSIRPCDTQSK